MSCLNPSMEDLPVPIVVDILSRLPIKTIIHCRFVCKRWRNLILDSYFANLQLSRSRAGFFLDYHPYFSIDNHKPGILKWVELEDELDHHHVHHDPVMSLDLGLVPIFQRSHFLPRGSVNGLICLWQNMPEIDDTYVCNPITREYKLLPLPRHHQYYRDCYAIVVYGFGVPSVIQEYKVIRIFQGDMPPNPPYQPRLIEAEVYTIGTGHWRSLGCAPYWLEGSCGIFLNGHVHWHVSDEDSPEKICAFDFEKETFRLFPSPPFEPIEEDQIHYSCLTVLKGCLCQSDATFDTNFTPWLMKEYGIKKSWHKEVVIKQGISPDLMEPIRRPVIIESLKDGTILMKHQRSLLAYCPKRKMVEVTQIFNAEIVRFSSGMPYRPSFLKLQNFESKRVHMF